MIKEPNRKIILTGEPNCGKTTVIRDVVELLRLQGVGARGFTTEPTNMSSSGFSVVTLNGLRLAFAHVDLRRGPLVGPYRVDINAFEEAVLPQLVVPKLRVKSLEQVTIIDEIGKLQIMSDRFMDRVQELFESEAWVLASVELEGGPFVQFLHKWARDRLIKVNIQNRDKLPERIVDALLLA